MTPNPILALMTEENKNAKDLSFILMGHSAFQILNAGCELKVFERLNLSPGLDKVELNFFLNLEERPLNCLLLGLTSINLVSIKSGKYYNCKTIDDFFKNNFWEIFYDTVVFENKIVYLGQYDFVDSLRTNSNIGLKRLEGRGKDLYHRLNEKDDIQKAFYNYMSSWSRMSIPLLLSTNVFKLCKNILDVGGGDATVAIEIAKTNVEAKITILEIPENADLANEKIIANGFEDRISIKIGDMFNENFGNSYDCVAFIHQLVIWSREEILFLLKKAHVALIEGGSLLIFSSITDDTEDGPLFGALDSVYFMSIPTANGGMIYPWKFYEACLKECGFSAIERTGFNSWSPHGLIVAKK
jgi:L-tyrosine C(3)-methyltransferase